MASRDASGKVLNAIAKNVPWLIGGAADLAPSTKTRLTFDGAGDFEADNPGGRNLHFGIREHAMGAIAQRHGAVQGAALRLRLPDLQRLRPAGDPPERDHGDPGHLRLHARLDRRRRGRADAPADRAARLAAGDPRPDHDPPGRRQRGGRGVAGHHASCSTSRRSWSSRGRRCRRSTAASTPRPAASRKGAYVLADAAGRQARRDPARAPAARCRSASRRYEQLTAEGIKARVVSMPSWELFEQQDQAYRDGVLPPDGDGPRLGRAGRHVRLGALRGPRRGRGSACRPSAPRRRSRSCRRSSASPSSASSRPPGSSSSGGRRRCRPDDGRHRRRPRGLRAQAGARSPRSARSEHDVEDLGHPQPGAGGLSGLRRGGWPGRCSTAGRSAAC